VNLAQRLGCAELEVEGLSTRLHCAAGRTRVKSERHSPCPRPTAGRESPRSVDATTSCSLRVGLGRPPLAAMPYPHTEGCSPIGRGRGELESAMARSG
jgi:hypothetical protein